MLTYLLNTFSLQMFLRGEARIKPISLSDAKMVVGLKWADAGRSKAYLPATSVIRQADICQIINQALGLPAQGFEYTVNKASVTFYPDDVLIVGQLLEGAEIRWYRVDLVGDKEIARQKRNLDRFEKVYCRFETATYCYTQVGAVDPKPLEQAAEECFPSLFEGMNE